MIFLHKTLKQQKQFQNFINFLNLTLGTAKTGKERNALVGLERYQGKFFKYNDTSRKTMILVIQG